MRIVSQASATAVSPRPVTDEPLERSQLFEYMCVCGIVRASSEPEVGVLASVPSTADIPGDLRWFAFPDRPPACKPATDGAAEFRRGFEDMQTGINTFMFCWNADAEKPVYVFVVRVWELFEEPSTWIGVDRVQTGSLIAGRRHLTERAYCIASRNPYARLFWQMLWELGRLEHLRLVATETAERQRQSRRIKCFIEMMTTLSTRHYAPGKELVLENRACFSTGVISYQVPGEWHSLRVSIAAICLPVLLRALSASNIATLVAALLTETRIVVVGFDPGRVSACVMALSTIIAPFAWQGSLFPLVPPALVELLQSPVPYLAGVATEGTPPEIEECVVTAFVDRNEVSVTGSLPFLPVRATLCATLAGVHERMRRGLPVLGAACDDRRPFDTLEPDKVLCTTAALEALSSYTVWVVASIRCCLPDASAFEYTADTIEFVCSRVRTENRAFVRALLNTQHWLLLATSFGALTLDDTGSGGKTYEAHQL